MRALFNACDEKAHTYDQGFSRDIKFASTLAHYDTLGPEDVDLLREVVEGCEDTTNKVMMAFTYPATGAELVKLSSHTLDDWDIVETALEEIVDTQEILTGLLHAGSPDWVAIAKEADKLVAAIEACEKALPPGKVMKTMLEVCKCMDFMAVCVISIRLQCAYEGKHDVSISSLTQAMHTYNRTATYHLSLGSVLEASLKEPVQLQEILNQACALVPMMRNLVQFLDPDFKADFDAKCKALSDFTALQETPPELEHFLTLGVVDEMFAKSRFWKWLAELQAPDLGTQLFAAVEDTLRPLLAALAEDIEAVLGAAPLTVQLSDNAGRVRYVSKEIQGFAQVLALAQRAGIDGLVRELLLLRDTHLLLREAAMLSLDFSALITPETRKITATLVDRVKKLTTRMHHLQSMDSHEARELPGSPLQHASRKEALSRVIWNLNRSWADSLGRDFGSVCGAED